LPDSEASAWNAWCRRTSVCMHRAR
jgi:hypothetical protein